MTVYSGVAIRTDSKCGAALYSNKPSSYLYSSPSPSCKRYLFPDPKMDQFSIIPSFKLTDKKVTFTMNKQLAVYYDNAFYFSLPELLTKIKLPSNLNQDLLDKIATIANYLAQGTEYEYVKGTAKEENEMLSFRVQNEVNRCRVTVPSYRKSKEINYEEIHH